MLFFSILFLKILEHILRTIATVKISNRSGLLAESKNAPLLGVISAHFPAPVSCHHKCCCLTLWANAIWQQRQELTLWGAQGPSRGGRTEDEERRGRAPRTGEEFSMDYTFLETAWLFPLLTQRITQSHPTRGYSHSLGFWAGSDTDLSDCN